MKRNRGFTLLEMMIAMAILSGSLTWIVMGLSRNIKASNHAKLVTTATFLGRQRMSQFEDELYEKGFGEFEKQQCGNFEDKGFAKFFSTKPNGMGMGLAIVRSIIEAHGGELRAENLTDGARFFFRLPVS